MPSIDFRGADSVVSAFNAKGLETWAVFNKNSFMQSGSGEASLLEYLTLMEQQGSTTIYCLKVYKDDNTDDITDKSACNGSFYFQLNDGRNGYMGGGNMGGGMNSNLNARLAAIEKKLNDEGPEKEPTLASTVIGWFQEPDDVVKILGAVKMFMGKSSPAEMVQAVQMLGAVEPRRAEILEQPTAVAGMQLTSEQENTLQRYWHVIDRLEKCDPEILLHLEQLAKMAETNQPLYKMALGFLK